MIKLVMPMKRRPGMTVPEFRQYYETRHRVIGENYLSGYASRYVRRFTNATRDRDGELRDPEYDVFLEIWYPDEATMVACGKRLSSAEARKEISEDEAQLFDLSSMRSYLVDEHESVAVAADPKTPSDTAAIAANIAGIANAVNDRNLAQYGSLVSEDFVNMNRDLEGKVTTTVGRQARLDVLAGSFEHSPYDIHAEMIPRDISLEGDRAFAQIDGTLTLTPKPATDLTGFRLTVDLYLFYLKDEALGWLSERSMGYERARAEL